MALYHIEDIVRLTCKMVINVECVPCMLRNKFSLAMSDTNTVKATSLDDFRKIHKVSSSWKACDQNLTSKEILAIKLLQYNHIIVISTANKEVGYKTMRTSKSKLHIYYLRLLDSFIHDF